MDKSVFDQLRTQLEDAKAQVDSWEAKEAEAKRNYEQMVLLANQNTEALESQITFNVGGTLFMTTKDTLLKVKDSYFTSMIQVATGNPKRMALILSIGVLFVLEE